MTVERG